MKDKLSWGEEGKSITTENWKQGKEEEEKEKGKWLHGFLFVFVFLYYFRRKNRKKEGLKAAFVSLKMHIVSKSLRNVANKLSVVIMNFINNMIKI